MSGSKAIIKPDLQLTLAAAQARSIAPWADCREHVDGKRGTPLEK